MVATAFESGPSPAEEGRRNLGERLRLRRRARFLTQEQLGRELGVRQQTVGRWENGFVPQRRFWPAIAAFLDLSDPGLVGPLCAGTEGGADLGTLPPPTPAERTLQEEVIERALRWIDERPMEEVDGEVLVRLLELVSALTAPPADGGASTSGPGFVGSVS